MVVVLSQQGVDAHPRGRHGVDAHRWVGAVVGVERVRGRGRSLVGVRVLQGGGRVAHAQPGRRLRRTQDRVVRAVLELDG